MSELPAPIFLKDYRPPAYLVEEVHLTFDLDETATRVRSRIRFVPNPANRKDPFFLHGEGLTLISSRIDGQDVTPEITASGLTCEVPDVPFTWAAEVEINPAENTSLEGLYMSRGMFCTQCEAEGFRKITYYPDRPDVLAPFTVRIESELPVQLSNGNPGESGTGWTEWHDPWPKPPYLFALVAGSLISVGDTFVTRSGRHVDLNIWVRPGDEDKCDFALQALKASMTWDEEVYGREYDLDIFNIVAVDDFNAGAMENKGLNIFNSALVLASPETATDADFERIESVIAHEYFHNWTGNRVTCRDWFQLCLKEGLTVFRDQQFTSDIRSAAAKRISDAHLIATHQFREDQGPLAHAVRPESFIEINNFYTITVYEKGAEIVGMLRRLVGETAYDDAVKLYFDRHDGQAVTIEDWLKAFEDTTGRDLTQFKRWYSQAGTPRLSVIDDFNDGTYTLTFNQESPPTADGSTKEPQVIPIAVGLLDQAGHETHPTQLLELVHAEQSFEFHGLPAKPVASILREFSAPVVLKREMVAEDHAFLLANDTDPFNRWSSGNALFAETLGAMSRDEDGQSQLLIESLRAMLRDDSADPALRALALMMPSDGEIAQHLHNNGHVPDPEAIFLAGESLKVEIAEALQDSLTATLAAQRVTGPYRPNAEDSGKRALAGAALAYISRIDGGDAARLAFSDADNMTQSIGALGCLAAIGKADAELRTFEDRWTDDRLVMDKWFSLQVRAASPETALQTTQALTEHPDFDWKNPNRLRSVIGAFSGNHAGFHHRSGSGYRMLTDWLLRLDPVNPQLAARMSPAFSTWTRYDESRQAKASEQMDRVLATDGLSRDLSEMLGRIRGKA